MKVVKPSEDDKQSVSSALFTGDVSRQVVFEPDDTKDLNFGIVNFDAGSRNKMHRHTSDQILIVTEGTGVVATEEGEQTVTVGDVILIPAGENHWHGAPGSTPMAHITVQAKDSTTTQTEP